MSTDAILLFVNSLNKNALELFFTSKVTLNRSLTFTSLVGNEPELTLVTSEIASRVIDCAVNPVTLLNVGTLLPETLYWIISPVLIPTLVKSALGEVIVDAEATAWLTVYWVAVGANKWPKFNTASALNL